MDLDTIYKDLEEIKAVVMELSITQKSDHNTLMEHDKILVRGNGIPSLQEIVRTLTKTVQDFIDDTKSEREKREKREVEEVKRKQEEYTRWKWSLIGIGLSTALAFAWQVVVFWVQVVPTLPK